MKIADAEAKRLIIGLIEDSIDGLQSDLALGKRALLSCDDDPHIREKRVRFQQKAELRLGEMTQALDYAKRRL